MILVLSGTGDGRKITKTLTGLGHRVCVLAATGFGRNLAVDDGAFMVNGSIESFQASWFIENGIQAVIDARHPFALKQEDTITRICSELGIMYLRVGREETALDSNDLIIPVFSMQEAAIKAAAVGRTIFLTTGSHDLEPFLEQRETHGFRLVVRVLPEHSIIRKCQDLGIGPKDIVAMQGPFSKQMNKALFKMYKTSVVVTKDSGKAGGTDTKIDAALSLKIPIVIVKRNIQDLQPCYGAEQVIKIINEKLI
ncbi:precorrin-6A reductase [Desulfotruncus alcoholivorax]|uniref:precorrin-6A reductase n=1 Tax=Desulfotruncus alcoholivorax TaxID=265477 RepID=UPI000419A76C|nr:precorrin-6A reductase [Desulfotruncus alcoholivorax]